MRNKKGIIWIGTGLLLIAAAFLLTGYNRYEEYKASETVNHTLQQLEAVCTKETEYSDDEGTLVEAERIPDYILNPDMQMPAQKIAGQDYIGILKIPALELELPIISTWSYPNLKEAPCRYTGSVYTNDIVIAGHNYRSHFAKLEELDVGEQVVFTDMEGNVFTYAITEREILNAMEVEAMQEGDWDMSLFTCTMDGTYRVTIRCEWVY